MAFHPLPDSGPEKPKMIDLGLFIIRVFCVATFFYYQLRDQLSHAQNYIWDSGEWNLIEQLGGKGLPLPHVVAVAAVSVFAISLLGVLVGILTRINALLLTLMTGFVLLAPLILSPTLNPQSLALYIGVFAGLASGGGGRLSLDYFLADRRAKRRKSA
ncbi:MAG: hypothetical protein ABL994_13835 [Verrucomicrobiales bacterium]